MNRPYPQLDAVLSAMLIAGIACFALLAVGAAFVAGLAVGKLVILPVIEWLL